MARCGFPSERQVRRRLGWLVRINRRYGPHRRFETLRELAQAFAELGGPVPSISALSRWESGTTPLNHDRIADYERILGLPGHTLTGLADLWARYAATTTASVPVLSRQRADRSRLDQLLEAAVTDAPMSGPRWDELTYLLATIPGVVLTPRSLWADLTQRLIVEANVADGVSWMLRSEALNRLLAHPAGQDAAITAVRDLALDRSSHSMAGTMSALEVTSHRVANRLVLRQITDPVTDPILYGALLASVLKIRDGHFSGSELTAVAGPLADLGADPKLSPDLRTLVGVLLDSMPMDVRSRVAPSRTSSSARLSDASRERTDRICLAVAVWLGADLDPVENSMLRQIIDEMLNHPVFDVRLYATFLLHATPCRAPLAAAITHELRSALGRREHQQAIVELELLRVLGGAAERKLAEQLLLAPGVNARVRAVAASALGHLPGHSGARFFEAALRASTARRVQDDASAENAVLHRLVYALGMTGHTALLRQIRDTPDTPGNAAAAARWWLALPGYISESVRT